MILHHKKPTNIKFNSNSELKGQSWIEGIFCERDTERKLLQIACGYMFVCIFQLSYSFFKQDNNEQIQMNFRFRFRYNQTSRYSGSSSSNGYKFSGIREEREEYSYSENRKSSGYSKYANDGLSNGMNGMSLDGLRKPQIDSWDSMGILGLSSRMWSSSSKKQVRTWIILFCCWKCYNHILLSA